jgi:hypothetical protein
MVIGMLLSIGLLDLTQALNESFPFVNKTDDLTVAALLDQRVYLSAENDDANTYYSLTIR